MLPRRAGTVALLVASAATWAVPAAAARHHPSHETHRPTVKKRASREAAHTPAAPRGAIDVPAGGLKIYCRRNNPLLVRKMTQGAGTTVTVICR